MLYEFELAGCLTEQQYEASIPPECSMTTMADHTAMMLCWGLVRAIEQGRKMNCDGCDENKVNYAARVIRIEQRKKDKANEQKAS